MTDSMKFGPEWLRNMSADTTASNTTNTAGCQINPAGIFCSINSGGGGSEGSSVNNANNNNSTNINNLHNNLNVGNSGTSRNTFPEFRYGREEMLLLFDRNCAIPEILPSYKNLFVERVQFPLALVPSTDEEMMQGTAPTAQRPGWLQRSPVGFSTATRGTGRVGCMERGRLRGKSVYHPVFQRPNAIFDEDQRSSAIKQTERGWSERNGVTAADSAVSSPSATVSGGLSADTWNGNTPMSSPRREFSNHHRNVENWRRSREEGSGSDSTTTPATFSADSGWRLNSSGFQGTHTRWGRSTSWRDDDLINSNETTVVSSGSAGVTGSNVMMLRSNSTLATTQCDRLGHVSGSGKQNGAHGGVTRSTSNSSSANKNTAAGNIWNNGGQSIGQMSNIHGDVSGNDEMALPEWAMENPSDIGGTFDASGAFHGAVDDNDHGNNNTNDNEPDYQQDNVGNEKMPIDTEVEEQTSKSKDEQHLNKSFKNSSREQTSKSPSPTLSLVENNQNNTMQSDKSDSTKNISPTVQENDPHGNVVDNDSSSGNKRVKESVTNANVHNSTMRDNAAANNAGDYTERTMKVTDDMIEKLIMDDEDGKIEHMKSSILSSDGCKRDNQNMFVSTLQQQNSSNATTVSPVLGGVAGPTGPPNMSLYNMSGIMVDHSHNMAALHQLQQQQMAAVTAVAMGLHHAPTTPHPITSSAPTDLWFYRDPQSKVQGPFSALEMTEWYRAGYFNENLFVRRVCDARFRPLGELIKICNGQMPFSHSHMIPIDLNTTAMTPPLPPVIAQPSAQTNDFVMKALNEHQQHQQHEKLKGNVTAAADSLSNALKSLINSVDISQVLNMHFQTLQDRFIHNQETEIVNELSKNECFRRLTPAEQEALVRQKLQRMVLPEYLTNLTGLSNSLAALNPTAGTQLYDTIAECTKKEQLFNNHQAAPPQATIQQHSNHHVSSSTPFMDPKDFILKTKNSGHEMNNDDLLNEFNMRLFLNNGPDSNTGGNNGVDSATNSHSHDFLNDQQLFGSTPTSIQNPTNNTSQSPMMQMWMNSLATTNQPNALPSQHPIVATNINNQWLNGPLVGIPSINLNREQHSSIIGSPKPTTASMWDVATLEQHVQIQQQQQKHEQQLKEMQQNNQLFENNSNLKDCEKHLQSDNQQQHQQFVNKQENKTIHQHLDDNKKELSSLHQNQSNDEQKSNDTAVNDSLTQDNNNKQDQRASEKSQIHINNNNNNNNKNRNSSNNNNIVAKVSSNKNKTENLAEQVSKKTEEDRRREINEEKRRQKEERKKLQMEEEKRRLLQAEEEKRRQLQEEEKRQQQIQAHRRKALTSNANNNNNNNLSSNSALTSPNSSNNQGNQKTKEQLRIQSSVAPWSSQTMTTKLQGPGLAEIQKAERRERRADQQRQLEIQEKQMRAVAAAAEAQDTALKWNAAPIPVKSFAEIQAEEAKRLAHEQMELQRRKEQETHNLAVFCSGSNIPTGPSNSSSNISNIWNGNKIWGSSSTNTGGFWEEPLKINNKSMSGGLPNVNNVTSNITAVTQTATTQQKTTAVHQSNQASATQQSLNKNVKKSQSMQNTTSSTASSSLNCQKKTSSNNTTATKSKSQSGINENKKSAPKNNNNNNKADDYEAEFINWCTKSLNNMSTKVDVPTFVSFLRDLESPYEVKDYIRMYLGESKEYIDFAKQFLERRSKYKNLQRAQNAHDDDLCKPAQAITPSVNDNTENKGKQKKVKKNKMTKLDARILGFSVTAAEGRINVGDRDYGDAS